MEERLDYQNVVYQESWKAFDKKIGGFVPTLSCEIEFLEFVIRPTEILWNKIEELG